MSGRELSAHIQDILTNFNLTLSQLENLSGQLPNTNGDESVDAMNSGTWTKKPQYILGLILGFIAITLNCLSLLAIYNIKHKLSTHFLLIASLACSDILTGISITTHVLIDQPSFCIFLVIKALNCSGLMLCLIHLAGMAADHYTAILYPLRHPQIMCRKNGFTLILFFWTFGLLLGFSKFYAEAHNISRIQRIYQVGFCESIWITRYQEEYCLFAIAFITCSMMTYIYIRIYVTIARHKSPGSIESPLHDHSSRSLFPVQHRRALVTTLLILGSFILCWMPHCVFEVTLLIQVKINRVSVETSEVMLTTINNYLYNLLLINAVLDPIIYASRLKEIRSGYKVVYEACCANRARVMQRISSSISRKTHSMDLAELRE